MAVGGYGAGMTSGVEGPRSRRTILLIAAASAATVVGLAIGGAYALGGREKPAARPSFAAGPPTLVALSEASACVRLVPLLTVAVGQLNEVLKHPDGSTADWGKVFSTRDELVELAPAVPKSLQTDVNIQIAALDMLDKIGHQERGVRDLDVNGVSAAGLRIAHACSPYATD